MDTQLLLITKRYPYGHGEEFIESEIEWLSQGFSRVVILASAACSDAEQTRPVPSNVTVLPADLPRITPVTALLTGGSAAKGLNPLLSAEDQRALSRNLKRQLYLRYFAQKTLACKAAIEQLWRSGIMKPGSASVLYSYWFHDIALAALLARDALGLTEMPIISRAHRYDVYVEASPAGAHIFRAWMLEHINNVFPVSNNGTQYLTAQYPEFSKKLTTAYLGTVDYGRGPYGLKRDQPDAFTIVSCSSMIKLKHVERIVEALAVLEEKVARPIVWHHFGSGPEEQRLRRLASQNLQTSKWRFAGHVPNSTLIAFYKENQVDAFISASESEGLPVTMMEAASFGIPLVVAQAGGVSEIVKDGVTGTLLAPSSEATPVALAQALACLAGQSAESVRALRSSVRAYWAQHFNAAANYQGFTSRLLALSADSHALSAAPQDRPG